VIVGRVASRHRIKITSFTATPNPLAVNTSVTLSASGINSNPTTTIAQVAFYLNANGDGTLEPGTDTLLGYGTNVGGTWSFSFNPTTSGTFTLQAVGSPFLSRIPDRSNGTSSASSRESALGVVSSDNTKPHVSKTISATIARCYDQSQNVFSRHLNNLHLLRDGHAWARKSLENVDKSLILGCDPRKLCDECNL
jgi:hypothetical protein